MSALFPATSTLAFGATPAFWSGFLRHPRGGPRVQYVGMSQTWWLHAVWWCFTVRRCVVLPRPSPCSPLSKARRVGGTPTPTRPTSKSSPEGLWRWHIVSQMLVVMGGVELEWVGESALGGGGWMSGYLLGREGFPVQCAKEFLDAPQNCPKWVPLSLPRPPLFQFGGWIGGWVRIPLPWVPSSHCTLCC